MNLNNALDQMDLTQIQNIPSKSRIYTLLKCTWNILQDRLHVISLVSRLKLYIKHLFQPQWYETRKQSQEETKSKIPKIMMVSRLLEEPMHQRNQGEIKKYLEVKTEIQHAKINELQQRKF